MSPRRSLGKPEERCLVTAAGLTNLQDGRIRPVVQGTKMIVALNPADDCAMPMLIYGRLRATLQVNHQFRLAASVVA
jgi:hypothetical protein